MHSFTSKIRYAWKIDELYESSSLNLPYLPSALARNRTPDLSDWSTQAPDQKLVLNGTRPGPRSFASSMA
jgi:hypothetical protein